MSGGEIAAARELLVISQAQTAAVVRPILTATPVSPMRTTIS
jgi:hypothetical protein